MKDKKDKPKNNLPNFTLENEVKEKDNERPEVIKAGFIKHEDRSRVISRRDFLRGGWLREQALQLQTP